MKKLEATLRKALTLIEAEQYGKAATLLDRAADGETASNAVARIVLDELEGDPESALLALRELLEVDA